MKFNKITTIAALSALALTACDEDKMDSWGTTYGDSIDASAIPVELAEAIARYDAIKTYATSGERGLSSDFQVGVGIGATIYTDEDSPMKEIVDENFNIVTFGNAMKHQSVVTSNGSLDFTTIDETVAAMPTDMLIYGHNFIWHTQQQSTYLKKLIAPTKEIASSSGDVCENIITNYDFETDMSNWSYWSYVTAEISSPGYNDSEGCAALTVTSSSTDNWDCQLFWSVDGLEEGVTYAYSYYAKSDEGIAVQFLTQQASDYSGEYYKTFTTTSEWAFYTQEFTYKGTPATVDRVGIQFGGTAGTLYLDDFKFGVAVEVEEDPMVDVLGDAGTFDSGEVDDGWGAWGSQKEASGLSEEGEGYGDTGYCYYVTNNTDGSSWNCQFAYTFDDYLDANSEYMVQFYAKCESGAGEVQFQYQNSSTSKSQDGYNTFTVTGDWLVYEYSFTPAYEDVDRIIFNVGSVADTYYFDNIKFGIKLEDDSEEESLNLKATVTYTLKTDEEKYELLDSAMEAWIRQMVLHMDSIAPGRVVAWDVVNEPITDGGNWRGLDNNYFMSDDDYTDEPWTEDETSGLTINWQDGHWYWAAFMGKDYAVKAFTYARQYAPNAKLFVNDYNLETNSTKLAALIEFVEYVESQGAEVDGIGTQMHISTDTDTTGIIEMFQTLATTGKLIRITELDITNGGGSSPTSDQLEAQSDMYKFVLDAYFQYIPSAQQYGVTAWSLSDNEAEHEYWLNGETPNLFDTNYERKHAYKGFCDGLAGYVVSDTFTSTVYTSSEE